MLSEIDDVSAGKISWQMNNKTYFVSISVSVIDLFAMEDMSWNSFVQEEFSTKTN